jgi:8-oxo-dGTP pyrophosphatase MutT (NUDIX family)
MTTDLAPLTAIRNAPWAPQPNTLTFKPGSRGRAPITSVLAVVVSGDRHVLAVHVVSRGWDLPGGHVEAGENALEALERELREESGLELSAAAHVGRLGQFHLHVEGAVPDDYTYPHPDSYQPVFLVKYADRPQPSTDVADDVDDVAWLAPSDLLYTCAERPWAPLLRRLANI